MGYTRPDVFKSSFFKADELLRPIKLQIHSATMETMGQGEDSRQRLVLNFKNSPLKFSVNATNWQVMEDAFGPDTDEWLGNTIELYRSKTLFKGASVACIRVRIPAGSKPAAEEPDEIPEDL